MANRQERIIALSAAVQGLTDLQLNMVENVIQRFNSPIQSWRNDNSDLVSTGVLEYIGDVLRLHHTLSVEPFTKDKFEYAMVNAVNLYGGYAVKAPNGNPGHDLTINNQRFSCKTQADEKISSNVLFVSKFMELGKGEWVLEKLLKLFLEHMQGYERIITLRALDRGPKKWKYELVEIPKALLLEAEHGDLIPSTKAGSNNGSCKVWESKKENKVKFNLYFDGKGERKLKITSLQKKLCIVHAEWKFEVN